MRNYKCTLPGLTRKMLNHPGASLSEYSRLHLGCPHRHATICLSGLLWHGVSFIIKQWVSRGVPAMYERSCQARTWNQRTSCCLSLIACLVRRSSVGLTIVQKVSCRACCQRIQLGLSSLLLSFTPTLQSVSSTSRSFSWLSWSTRLGSPQDDSASF